MKHRARVSTFGRATNARNALLRSLVNSLVEHGRITTTVAKAKELRRHAEKAITLGKKNTLHAKRLLLSRYPNLKTVEKIVTQIAPHFKDRNGGYTRIMKLGTRLGDRAEMAVIELLDWTNFSSKEVVPAKAAKKTKAASAKKAAKSEAAPAKKAKAKA
ncbi:MAG: 50S ribosomal protein L17 [Bdellovibrionales bacterium]